MSIRSRKHRKGAATVLAVSIALVIGTAAADNDDSIAVLRSRYAEAGVRLANSPFHRPLYLDSSESRGQLEGSIHARINQPFARLRSALSAPEEWCGVLLLLPNIAECHPVAGKGAAALRVGVVRRFSDKPDQATLVRFSFAAEQDTDGLQVRLRAPDGPLGTHDYRLALQAIPVDGDRSFLHLHYAYEYGWAARVAGKAYLATSGSDKIGFSSSGQKSYGSPQYIAGLRGAVERNAMRCYLAIEAHLDTVSQPGGARFDASLDQWMKSIAQYPKQLQEEDPQAYRDAKRRDARRSSDASIRSR